MNRFLIDLHCHTQDHSYDGQVPAEEMCRKLLALGFAGVAFTDHNYVWPQEELEELRERAGLPGHFCLFSGQEVRTASEGIVRGDLLVFGVPVCLPDDTDPRELFRLINEHGGFCLAPHPGVPRIGFEEDLANFPIVAAESWNGRYGRDVARRSRLLIDACGLPEFGGSDAHRPEEIGGGGTTFPRTPESLEDIARMLSAGEGQPWIPGSVDRMRRWLRKRMAI